MDAIAINVSFWDIKQVLRDIKSGLWTQERSLYLMMWYFLRISVLSRMLYMTTLMFLLHLILIIFLMIFILLLLLILQFYKILECLYLLDRVYRSCITWLFDHWFVFLRQCSCWFTSSWCSYLCISRAKTFY